MKIVVSMDAFKGSLNSWEAGSAAKKGIEHALAGVGSANEVVVFPLAEGGAGVVEALTSGDGGKFEDMIVDGPLGDPVSLIYGVLKDQTIIMELSQAAGRTLLSSNDANPMKTSTYGLGQAIADAITKYGPGLNFKIEVDGSATNDCGVGMLRGLGYRFLDDQGNELRGCGEDLVRIAEIDDSGVIAGLDQCHFEIATDTDIVLCGEEGAAYKFGPSKGADDQMIQDLDDGMRNFADVVFWYNATDETQTPGVGCAGGLGYAFTSFTNCSFSKSSDMKSEAKKIRADLLEGASLMVTGASVLEADSLKGTTKAINMAKECKIPVVAIGGSIGKDLAPVHDAGISACFAVNSNISDVAVGMQQTAEEAIRMLILGGIVK